GTLRMIWSYSSGGMYWMSSSVRPRAWRASLCTGVILGSGVLVMTRKSGCRSWPGCATEALSSQRVPVTHGPQRNHNKRARRNLRTRKGPELGSGGSRAARNFFSVTDKAAFGGDELAAAVDAGTGIPDRPATGASQIIGIDARRHAEINEKSADCVGADE